MNFSFSAFSLSSLRPTLAGADGRLWRQTAAYIGRHAFFCRVVVNLAAIVFGAWILGRAVGFKVEQMLTVPAGWESRIKVHKTGQAVKGRAELSLADYSAIAAVNMFATRKAPPPVKEEKKDVSIDQIPLALSSLNLNLVGTVVGTDPLLSVAVIEDKISRSEDLYREGDKVKSARVKKILRTNVIIETGGKEEILSMDPERLARERENSRAGGKSKGARQAPARTIELDRNQVEESLRNIPSLLRDARIFPYRKNGELAGYRISRIKPGSVYSKLGLRNNDVLMGLNGRVLSTPDQLLDLYDQVSREGGGVDLEVKRGGKKEMLRYELR